MTIKITPHGYRADITVDSMEEAREVLRELTPSTIGCFPPVAENIPAPSSSGLATESAATTATGVVEGGPVDDLDDNPSAPRYLTWSQPSEEKMTPDRQRRTTPLSEAPLGRRRWTEEQDEELIRLLKTTDMTMGQIGADFGRTTEGIQRRAAKLRKDGRL